MTKEPNPNQIPSSNDQIPKKISRAEAFLPLGFGAWSLGFDWDLAPWSLVIVNFATGHRPAMIRSCPPRASSSFLLPW
jgi:hypothetical protein